MDDGEDELRRAIARGRMARRILDAIAAEKLARASFEEGIREQMRLRGRLLADRAECLEKPARAEADIERVRAERGAAAAAVDKRTRKRWAAGGLGVGRGGGAGGRKIARRLGRWGKGPACRRRSRYMIRLISAIADLPWARQVLARDARCAY